LGVSCRSAASQSSAVSRRRRATWRIADDSEVIIVAWLRRDHLDEIRRTVQGEIPVDAHNWRTYLAGRPPVVRALVEEFPTTISRDDLRTLAAKQNSAANRERLFVAAMMWGRGKKNARMLPGLRKCLGDRRLSAALKRASHLLAEGLPGDAYNSWTQARLPGLREAFFTKWLFASGLATDHPAYLQPLVLDRNVWRSLAALGWSSVRTSGFRYRTNPAAGYCAYLRAARDWANQLSTSRAPVTAEQIEIFLFTRNGALEAPS
jgi:hypothetical protein